MRWLYVAKVRVKGDVYFSHCSVVVVVVVFGFFFILRMCFVLGCLT